MSEHNDIEIIDLDPDEVDTRISVETPKQNIGTNQKIISGITNPITCVDKNKKTLALIPVDYLKYCNVENGKFMVKLDTLNQLNTKNSVYLYNVPKGQYVNTMTQMKSVVNPKDNIPTSLPGYVKILPKLSSATISSPNKFKIVENNSASGVVTEMRKTQKNTSKILLNSSPPPLSSFESTSKNMFEVNSTIRKGPPFYEVKDVKKIEKAPKIVSVKNYFVRNIIKPVQSQNISTTTTSNSNGENKISSGKIVPTNTPKKKFFLKSQVQVAEKLKKIKKSEMIINTVERDPLELPIDPLSNYANLMNPPPLISYSDQINRKKRASETDSVEESPKSYFDSDYSSNVVPNIFEPIITLNETEIVDPNNKNLESSLTEGLKGDGISNEKLAQLEKMIMQKSVKSPMMVKIPSKFLKYCTKKNGKYMVDINALKKINMETQIEKKLTKEITQKQSQATTQQKLKNLHKSTMILNPRIATSNNVIVIPQGATSSDKCRHLFLKSSAWELIDPESKICKGFNERELKISQTCSKNFQEYLKLAKEDSKKLYNNFFDSNNEDLYFTKKIEILDLKGKKIRTEHVTQKKNISKTEILLKKMKKCSVRIKRNDKVEEAVKKLIRYKNLRKTLESKLIKSVSRLNLKGNKPMLVLNENNIECLKLTELLCLRTNMIFVKKPGGHLSNKICDNLFFVEMIERNLINIVTPNVLQNLFSKKNVCEIF